MVQDALTALDVDGLFELFEQLRLANFRVDVTHLRQMHDILLAAAAAGAPLDNPDRIRNWLGPIVCQSAADQREFARIFDAWMRGTAGQVRSAQPGVLDDLDRAETSSRPWRWILIAPLAAACAAALLYALSIGGGGVPGVTPPLATQEPSATAASTTWLTTFAWTVAALAAAGLVYVLLWVRLARRFLVRESGPPPRSLELLPLRATSRRLYSAFEAAKVASACRARVRERVHEIDELATIERTIAAGGVFSPVFGYRRVMPEYLALIDRKAHRDQQAAFLDDLFDQLVRRGVWVQRYYFDGDPRLCFPERASDDPTTLAELANRFSNHRLLVCADSTVFADSLTGEPAAWVPMLTAWAERTALLPGGASSIRFNEQLARYLPLLPATLEGIQSFVAQLRGQQQLVTPRPIGAAASPPSEIAADPERWIERSAPEGRVAETMVSSLRAALTPREFSWMSACAVYPAMHWNMTLALGYALEEQGDGPLVTPRSVATLAQLPWFKHAYMPDWFRRRLVDGMPSAEDRVVRATLDALLISAVRGGTGDLALQIATATSKIYQRLALLVRLVLVRRGDAPSEWNDYIFLRFMTGRRARSLAVRVPDAFRSLRAKSRDAGAAMTVPANAETRSVRLAATVASIASPLSIVTPLLTRDRYVRFHAYQAVMVFAALALTLLLAVTFARYAVPFMPLLWVGAIVYLAIGAWRGRPAAIPLITAVAASLAGDPEILVEHSHTLRSTTQQLIGALQCRPSVYAEIVDDPRSLWLAVGVVASVTALNLVSSLVRWLMSPALVKAIGEISGRTDQGLAAHFVGTLMSPFIWLTWSGALWLAARIVLRSRAGHPAVARGVGAHEWPTFRRFAIATGVSNIAYAPPILISLFALLVTHGTSAAGASAADTVPLIWVYVALYGSVRGALYRYTVRQTVAVLGIALVCEMVLNTVIGVLLLQTGFLPSSPTTRTPASGVAARSLSLHVGTA